MNDIRATLILTALIAVVMSGFAQQDAGRAASSAGGAQGIKVTAKKYEFIPNVITVKQGDHVKLMITALDHNHGFKLAAFDINQRLEKGVPTAVEFTADKAGTFPFECSVVCGLGHHRMKGKLVVEATAAP